MGSVGVRAHTRRLVALPSASPRALRLRLRRASVRTGHQSAQERSKQRKLGDLVPIKKVSLRGNGSLHLLDPGHKRRHIERHYEDRAAEPGSPGQMGLGEITRHQRKVPLLTALLNQLLKKTARRSPKLWPTLKSMT